MNPETNNLGPTDAFEADLKAYLDGELPLLRRYQVRAHLARCPKCQEELKLMQTIETELKEEETAPLAADLRAKILQNAPLETSIEAPKVTPKRNRRVALEYAFVLVPVCFVALLITSVTGNRIKNTFNSAAAQVGVGEYDMPVPPPSALKNNSSASVGAPSPPSDKLMDSLEVQRRSVTNWDRRISAPKRAQEQAAIAGGASTAADTSFLNQRAVHKEGTLTIAVADAEKSGADAERIVKSAGGFVATNSLSTGANEQRSATLDCRIPVDKFETVVQKVAAMGSVRAKSINGEDITVRVAAASARKSTLSDELSIASAQLRQKEKSRKAGDVQSVYYARLEVRNLRLQAAQAKSQLEVLRRFADLSSLYLTVQEKPKPAPVASSTSELSQTTHEAWKSFLTSARLPIQLIIWILAYSPLWVPVLIVWQKWGRKWMSTA